MSKPELIKRSGWLFVAGALAFITIMSSSHAIQIPGSVISAILLSVGMSSLRQGYDERIGRLGRRILRLGMAGPVLWFIVIASLVFTQVTETQITEGLWVLLFLGPAISLLGLTLFGLTALVTKPMPRFNWLPLLAGIWYPVGYTLFSIYDISNKGVFPDQYLPVIILTVVIQFISLCVLGFALIEDSSRELATV